MHPGSMHHMNSARGRRAPKVPGQPVQGLKSEGIIPGTTELDKDADAWRFRPGAVIGACSQHYLGSREKINQNTKGFRGHWKEVIC